MGEGDEDCKYDDKKGGEVKGKSRREVMQAETVRTLSEDADRNFVAISTYVSTEPTIYSRVYIADSHAFEGFGSGTVHSNVASSRCWTF